MSSASATTKRWIAIAGLAATVLLVAVMGLGATGGDGNGGEYRVRAIFDTASFLVPGEDVKVAGVKIGTIESLDVTIDNKAAIVLKITDPAFQDFKRDATCTIRLQSLIGEKFVSCKPTQPKPAGSPDPGPLRRIGDGEHEGQYLLPVESTSAPVDIDLLNNIMREPQRQRFALILNELGVGLAGNGEELRRVVRRANPALREFDELLGILAAQDRVLADLARDSDRALASVASEADRITAFVDKAGETATATAERGDALEANFERFPRFLEELTLTMRELGAFAAAGAPVMDDLRAVAPSVSQIFRQLGPLTRASTPALKTLGDAADVGREALVNSEGLIDDFTALGRRTKPLARMLAAGLTDLQDQHGIERLLDVILYTMGTGTGFDDVSHYLRSFLWVNNCLEYTLKSSGTCMATFDSDSQRRAASSEAGVAGASTSAAAPTSDATGGARAGLLDYLLGNEGDDQ